MGWSLTTFSLQFIFVNMKIEQQLNFKLKKSLEILRKYEWLLDAYILDFYVDDHWSKMPKNWRAHMENLEPEELHDLLEIGPLTNRVWPLSLLALKKLMETLSISRKTCSSMPPPKIGIMEDPKMRNIFTKCVKPKKRHEVMQMASVCQRSCQENPVDFVVDFGAGLGHLARVLGYGLGIRVCCLEMQQTLNEQAGIIDSQLEIMASKHLSPNERAAFQRPTHITLKLTSAMSPSEFLNTLKTALLLSDDRFTFGIIGLHPCGDLGAILMRMFLNCEQAKFINFVGCCYMKLTTPQMNPEMRPTYGYPLSEFLSQQSQTTVKLSYEMLEISCHAIEMYRDRLVDGEYENLKIHSFRAAAERVLVQHRPENRHCGLRSVKHVHDMQFEEYFGKAIDGLAMEGIQETVKGLQATIDEDLQRWKRVVVFYTLRLMLAPLVESVILYDRMLFLLENKCHVSIEAIFDARLSPRNHITCAVKRK